MRRNRDGGFGFSISGGGGGAGREDALRICRVDALSHAWQVGLEVGDELLSVDSIEVTRLPVNSVAAIIRFAPDYLSCLQIPKTVKNCTAVYLHSYLISNARSSDLRCIAKFL